MLISRDANHHHSKRVGTRPWNGYAVARAVRSFSFRRLTNTAKVIAGYLLSRLTHTPVHWGMPLSVSIEPTTSCNLRCPECPSGLRSFTRPTGMLELSVYREVIDQLYRDVGNLILYFQGEPYLHPGFFEMVRYAHSKKMIVTTSTNAHYLNDERARATVESGLDRLIISIDGTTQETYEAYRVGGNLASVIDGTQRIIAWKHRLRSTSPQVIFQFVAFRSNEHQVAEVHDLARRLGVDTVLIKTAQIYDYEQGNDRIPVNLELSRYAQKEDGRYAIKSELLNHCWRLWSSAVITWDGIVVPCCFDKDAAHRMGNSAETPFAEIWRGDAYRQFRTKILRSRSAIDICTNCTEGTKIWA